VTANRSLMAQTVAAQRRRIEKAALSRCEAFAPDKSTTAPTSFRCLAASRLVLGSSLLRRTLPCSHSSSTHSDYQKRPDQG
jgi:hypothetical protein